MGCLLSARYVLQADILRQSLAGDPVNLSEEGEWVEDQDPLTGAPIRLWKPLTDDSDPNAPKVYSIDCMANGIIDGGIRVAGTTERFEADYKNIDYVRMFFGPQHILTKRDRVTNIRNKATGQVIWSDEENNFTSGVPKATVFDVDGVTPIVNHRGRHVENFANLKKAEGS